MMEGIKVKLLVDLIKYNPELKKGLEGITAGQTGIWSRGSDRFIGVNFPGVGNYDILWQSLEITDKVYLEKQAGEKKKEFELLKSAKNVVEYVGPKGGFKHLTYEYIDERGITAHQSCGFKDKAQELKDFFKKQGIEVKIRVY